MSADSRPYPLREHVDEITRGAVELALRDAKGVKKEAARLLGVSRPTLDAMIARYEIDLEDVRR